MFRVVKFKKKWLYLGNFKIMAVRYRDTFYKAYMNRNLKRGELLFDTPDALLLCCVEYFDWCVSNPIPRPEQSRQSGKKGGCDLKDTIDVLVPRPMTKSGLAAYLGVHKATLNSYATDMRYEAYHSVMSYIFEIIDNQQYENALVGNYKENIVSRGIGLAENMSQNVTLKFAITYEDMNNED